MTVKARIAQAAVKKNGFDPAPLERARRLQGLTYQDLARLIGKKTAMSVRLTLIGQSSAVKTVAALADALEVNVAECWPELGGPGE